MSETVPFHGLNIVEQETRVYRDSQGRPRIAGLVIAEPKASDGKEIPDEPDRPIGTVESINDDGTVTVEVR